MEESKMRDAAIRFLIQCYFGGEEDPILAAIDKAYIDMQTHTLTGDKETELFPQRKDITERIYKAIKSLPQNEEETYDEWHKNLSIEINKNYKKLTYGQIQKWINMTVKYLFTLKMLNVEGIDDYFSEEHMGDFHAPIDSFVLNQLNKGNVTWSKIDSYEDYYDIRENITFEEEYENWPSYAKKAKRKKNETERKADKGTYRRYLQEGHPYKLDE